MFWRLLLGIFIGFLAYKVYQRVKAALTLKSQTTPPPRVEEPDTLVQDPICGTFVPRRDALKASQDGKDYFFCSEGCLKRFRRAGPRGTGG